MARTIRTIATINSVIRTALALALLGGVGYAGYHWHLQTQESKLARLRLVDLNDQLKDANGRLQQTEADLQAKTLEVERQGRRIAEQAEQIDKLDMALRLLKVDRRVARLSVLAQDRDPDSGEVYSEIEFVELNDRGEPLDEPKRFTVQGDLVYVDNLVVKFEDKYIETADLDRSTSLVMFRRLFGEYQAPQQGFALENVGQRPKVYSGDRAPSDFERRIWSDFWAIANDRDQARELGIRAMHGEAVSVRVRPGNVYRIVLRASDGLSIQLDNEPPSFSGSGS